MREYFLVVKPCFVVCDDTYFWHIVNDATWWANGNGVCQTFGTKSKNKTRKYIIRSKMSYIRTTFTLESVSRCHDLDFVPRLVCPTLHIIADWVNKCLPHTLINNNIRFLLGLIQPQFSKHSSCHLYTGSC